MDPYLSFHKNCNYVTVMIDKRNKMLKALTGSSWEEDKETLLLTYNALRKSIASNVYQYGAQTQMTRTLRRYNSEECGSEDGHRDSQDGQY